MTNQNEIWKKTLSIIEEEATSIIVSTWFDDCQVINLTSDKIVLHTPVEFKREMIQGKYLGYVKSALNKIFGYDIEITILAGDELKEYESAPKPKTSAMPDFTDYTFENFVVGPSNKFAHAAAWSVANNPGQPAYNPLLIYGGSGLGKTHLLYAIASTIHKQNPDCNIIYLKGDDFTNELVRSLGRQAMAEFRNKYRQADLLLMDDIHFIAGKEQTQEEFFNTFNALFDAKKQIVLTSDRPPKSILALESRLRSRFEAGLLADVTPPDYETRIAIIEKKALSAGLILPEKYCEYIAKSITMNVRQIEGTIKKIVALKDLLGVDVTMDLVTRAVSEVSKSSAPTPSNIINEVSRCYSVPASDITGKSQKRECTIARQVSMYLMRELTSLSLPEIGREFGGKDHTTVLYAYTKIEEEIRKDDSFKASIDDLKANICDN